MTFALLTNCTNRKRRSALPLVAWNGAGGDRNLDELASEWTARIAQSSDTMPSDQLYVGRSVIDARHATRAIGAELYFVSAGLGLLRADAQIPPYNLTASAGANSILPALRRLQATPTDWWHAIARAKGIPNPIARLANTEGIDGVLIAVPASYLPLIMRDLGEVADSKAGSNLRIFSSSRAMDVLPETLHTYVMPYDIRLNAIPKYDGTTGDFPQRAIRHFIDELQGHRLSIDDARIAVCKTLQARTQKLAPVRKRATDDEITDLVRRHWNAYGGQSSRLLRFLRDDASVACEQGRFRRIWLRMREESDAK